MAQSERVTSADEDAPVVRDGAYYAEVFEAVGRGAPTLLLGTSTRSLARSVKKLQEVQGGSSKATSQSNVTDAVAGSEQRPRSRWRAAVGSVFVFCISLAGLIALFFYASVIPWWGIALSAFAILICGGMSAIIFYDDFLVPTILLPRKEARFHQSRARDSKKRISSQRDDSQKRT